MKINFSKITSAASRAVLKSKKASPYLLTGVGIAAAISATVLACKATLRADAVLAEHQDCMNDMKAMEERKEETPEQIKKWSRERTIMTAKDLARLYIPSVSLGAVAIGCLIGGQSIQYKRNTALMAAYATLDATFKKYRERVGEDHGLDYDREAHAGVKEGAVIYDGYEYSRYARFFDETRQSYQRNPEYNRIFLKCQEKYANDMLRARGHVFLNEVYDMLGIPRSKEGAVVGWVWRDGDGDGYIDFGVSVVSPSGANFLAGNDPAILLDFNVDGVIYDKI